MYIRLYPYTSLAIGIVTSSIIVKDFFNSFSLPTLNLFFLLALAMVLWRRKLIVDQGLLKIEGLLFETSAIKVDNIVNVKSNTIRGVTIKAKAASFSVYCDIFQRKKIISLLKIINSKAT